MSFLQIIDEMFGCFAYEWKDASLRFAPDASIPALSVSGDEVSR